MEMMQRLTQQMDRAVNALKEQNDLEAEVYLLVKTAASLIEKLEKRDKEIMNLRSELMLVKQQLLAYATVEIVTNDE